MQDINFLSVKHPAPDLLDGIGLGTWLVQF
ncbi:hypothetical protein DYBT9275_01888 [Dyadobacter sp. CECT 9275]|uniref:Uncharacterized protein n=1 Tax=Dyadobacter helix TaxID=2822344 RepID=A0A916JBH5_9BACT|nr:hypothetical protein DYBT9275_01888 [Dyadobacter sp. CECT 9275]